MPSRPDSARLLRSRDCNINPEHDNEAPTITEFKIRGSLMFNSIFLLISFPGENILNKSESEIEVLPIINDSNIEIIKIIKKTISIISFFDNIVIVLSFKIKQSNYICNE